MRADLITLSKFHEECGLFGVYGHPEAANITYLGLHALQHRGQEGSGIVSSDGRNFCIEKGSGLVLEVFNKERLERLPGHTAIGHNRYSTSGGAHDKNLQPFLINFSLGHLALAHNGNLVNAQSLRDELEAYGAIFQSSVDSEVIMHLIAHSREDSLIARIVDALTKVKGAFSLLFLSSQGLIAVRDPYGFRPLSLGRLRDGWVVSSETVAFNLVEAEYIRDLEPGELVVINEKGVTAHHPFPKTPLAQCVFEHVYFSRPDSHVFGHSVYSVRKRHGIRLATEAPVAADVVIPVPDSGIPAALGFSEGSGIRFEEGLVRSHYIGRTFIEPQDSIRHFGVRIKLSPIRDVLEGQRVVVVDDSLVRGTTSRKLLKMIRGAGAKEVHLRIASPPIISPCFYGIDTPTRQELIATSHDVEETRRYIEADTLAYLSREGLFEAFGPTAAVQQPFCDACFTAHYPVPFTKEELVQLGLF
jgi:amidophosphoribosyltransferase